MSKEEIIFVRFFLNINFDTIFSYARKDVEEIYVITTLFLIINFY